MDKQETIEIGLNYKLFTTSIVLLSKFLIEKINEQSEKNKALLNMQEVCKTLITTYEELPIEKDNGTIIKKLFMVLKNNIELVQTQNENLFTKRNAKNKITTIIPGLDIRLIYQFLSDKDKQTIWNYIKLSFIATVKLIYSSNKSKCDENITKISDQFEIELAKNGINTNEMKFNPFIGTGNSKIDIKSVENNVDASNIFNMLNIDKLIDVNQLKEQLNVLSEADIKKTTDSITHMLGNADDDVKEVCTTLVQNLVEDLKQNGLQNLFETLKNVSDKVSKKIDVTKIKKTAGAMNSFMEKSEEHFKNMKDENGNNPMTAFKGNPELLLSFAQKCFNNNLNPG
jgi:hypothetical protein